MRFLHRIIISALCLAAMLPLLAAVTAPLTLTATADRAVLLATARQYRRALADEPKFDIETAQVTLTFTNTSTLPLKLNAFRLPDLYLQLEISGPEQQSVIRKKIPMMMDGTYAVKPADFPVLQPAQSWQFVTPLYFPNGVFSYTCYLLQRTGVYHVRFLYGYTPSNALVSDQLTMEDGSFMGAVASNELTFKILEAGDPVKGLQAALDVQPSPDPLSGALTLTAYLRNVSAQPFSINDRDLFHNDLRLTQANRDVTRFSSAADAQDVPAAQYSTLPPGEKHAFPLHGSYYPLWESLHEQTGHVSLSDNYGCFNDWIMHGNVVAAGAYLGMPEPPALPEAAGPRWAGEVCSPLITVPLNPTAYRQAKLKQDLSRFVLELNYTGVAQDKPFYGLRLQVEPQKQPAGDIFNPVLQISETEASTLIDYLAQSGALRDATTIVEVAAAPMPTTGYTMGIFGDTNAGKGDIACWQLSQGWDLKMYRQLAALQTQLPAGAQAAMTNLLARLTGLRAIWEAEDALTRRISLTLPAGTLADAVNTVKTATNCPSLKGKVDNRLRATPIPALRFDNLTAAEACQYLAQAASADCTINEDTVMFTR